jgi:hypothetical protein
MSALHRRLLRLESRGGRHAFAHLTDAELDRRLREELAAWLATDPAPLPVELRAGIATFIAAPAGSEGASA